MSGTVNRNVAPASACAENSVSINRPSSSVDSPFGSQPLNTSAPGQLISDVKEERIKSRERKFTENEFGSAHYVEMTKQVDFDSRKSIERNLVCYESAASLETSMLEHGGKEYQESKENNSDASSTDELEEMDGDASAKREKALTPAISGDRNGFPAIILSDMKNFIEALKPMKFSKIDNYANKLIIKFKKTWMCPKCQVLHGHTSQGVSSNQYGGTAPFKCRSSSQQLVMMLPQDLIVALGKIYKTASSKDASMFAAWLGSSKAVKKEEILKNLNFEMQIDDQPEYIDEEGEILDLVQVQDSRNFETQTSGYLYDSFSEAEFRSAITEELMTLKNRISALESENSLLRQENAVLKKYRPDFSQIKVTDPKLPTSTTSLAPINSYLEVTKVYTPQPVVMKRTKVVSNSDSVYKPKIRPEVDMSLFTACIDKEKEKSRDSSKLVFIYFKGLVRRRQSEYRALFDKIGFGGYKARDILFLSEDFMQVLTYEDCVDELVTLIGKFFPAAKFMKDADPTDPSNYESHGKLSRTFLEAQYFITMEGAVQRFRKLAIEKPFLKRTLYFLEKVVSTRNSKYEKSPEKPKVFLMNSFLVLDKPEQPKKITTTVDEVSEASNQAPMEISQ